MYFACTEAVKVELSVSTKDKATVLHAICYYGRSQHLISLINIVKKKKYDTILTSKQEIDEQQLADEIIVKLRPLINQVDNSGMSPYRLAMADIKAAGRL